MGGREDAPLREDVQLAVEPAPDDGGQSYKPAAECGQNAGFRCRRCPHQVRRGKGIGSQGRQDKKDS